MNDFIFEQKNFSSEASASLILKKIKEADLPFKKSSYNIYGENYEYHDLQEEKDFKEIIKENQREIKTQIDKYFESYDVHVPQQDFLGTSVLYLKTGSLVPRHTDDPYDMGTLRNIGVLLYLNTLASGGELIFPLQRRSITPEAGKLLIFPSAFTHPHQVMPSFTEDRYALRFNYGIELNE